MYRKHTFQPGQQVEIAAYRMAEQRCKNPNDPTWKDYGGRGIEFRFKSFREFWETVGPRPEGQVGKRSAYSLGRVDRNGHYEPGNAMWMKRSGRPRRRPLDGWSLLPSGKSVMDFVVTHPDLTYEQIGSVLGCSAVRVCQIMTRANIRRTRGKRPDVPVPGTRFGLWTVVSYERLQENKNEGSKWLCKCDCGTECWVRSNNLKSGGSTNCGCMPPVMRKIRSDAWTPELRALASQRTKQFHIDNPQHSRSRRKLADDKIPEIKRLHAEGAGGYTKLGKLFGVSPSTIEHILKGKTYKDS